MSPESPELPTFFFTTFRTPSEQKETFQSSTGREQRKLSSFIDVLSPSSTSSPTCRQNRLIRRLGRHYLLDRSRTEIDALVLLQILFDIERRLPIYPIKSRVNVNNTLYLNVII